MTNVQHRHQSVNNAANYLIATRNYASTVFLVFIGLVRLNYHNGNIISTHAATNTCCVIDWESLKWLLRKESEFEAACGQQSAFSSIPGWLLRFWFIFVDSRLITARRLIRASPDESKLVKKIANLWQRWPIIPSKDAPHLNCKSLNDGGGTLSKSLDKLSVDELKCFIKLTYLLRRVTSPKVTVKTKRDESENESNIDTTL